MSFKLKTVLGIALIEVVMLLILVISGVHYIKTTNEERFLEQGRISANLLANMTADAVIALDLATLDVLTENAVRNENVVFVKVHNIDGDVLSQSSDRRPVAEAYQLRMPPFPITVGGKDYGHIEVGLNTQATSLAVNDALRWMGSIAAVEILLVALFGYVLGNILVAQLKSLRDGVIRVEEGEFGYQMPVTRRDEFAETALRFNEMSRALSAYRTQANMAFEHALVGILLIGEQGRIQGANPQAQRVFGYTPGQMDGVLVEELLGAPGESVLDSDAFADGTSEVKGYRKGGVEFPALIGVQKMPEDESTRFVVSVIDKSIEQSLQAQLQQAQKMETLGHLVGGIAHDFNNILTIVIGNISIAAKQVGGVGNASERLATARIATERAADLTRKLLIFSRHDGIDAKEDDINTAIADMKELIQSSVTQTIEVQENFQDGLPSVQFDRTGLQDCIINLAINARDAMPAGGSLLLSTSLRHIDRRIDPALRTLSPGDYVEISVTDNGHGIPREIQHQIFDPFFSTKERGKGTGLGLSMVYAYMKRHKGAIVLYSEEHVGTAFKMYLPCANSASTGSFETSDRNETTRAPPPAGNGATVLVIDDEQMLLELAKSVLQDHGYIVITAASGEEALDVLHDKKLVDVIVTDVIMGRGLNGYEFAERARAICEDIPIQVMTGFAGNSITGIARASQHYPILRKPYSGEELLWAVADLLRPSELRTTTISI